MTPQARPRTPERTLDDAATLLTIAVRHIHPAIRNLREVQPGYPSTTPGSGNPGGGGSAPGTATSLVERLAAIGMGNDDAVRDLAELQRHIAAAAIHARWVHDLCLRWGYRTAGEYRTPGDPQPRPAGDREPPSSAARWCTNCSRHGVMSPVHRGDLCRWCSDFAAAEGVVPPGEFVDMHARGVRLSTARVDAWRRANRPRRRRRR